MCFIYFSCILSFFSYETFTNLNRGQLVSATRKKLENLSIQVELV